MLPPHVRLQERQELLLCPAMTGVDSPRARPRRRQELPHVWYGGDRRLIPMTTDQAGDGMRDRRWRLGRRHVCAEGEAGDGGAAARAHRRLGT
jgi:hypothetical protein